MSTSELIGEENDREYVDDDPEGVNGCCCRLLKAEHEKCRQEIHDLKRKLQLNETILREVQETDELLERSLDRRVLKKDKIILEMEEKHRVTTAEYTSIVSNLETQLAKRAIEMEELRQHSYRHDEADHTTTIEQSANISLKAENVSLKNRVDQLLSLLHEEKERRECVEETMEGWKNRCNEFEQVSRNTKEQLSEKSKALENAREELILKRAEAASLAAYADSAPDSCKGNSLFAEVEDRRRNAVSKMNALRDKYADVKRLYKTQAAEIKMLRTERAATLRKYENDAVHTLMENDELIRKYKQRISDLEMKLKSENKQNDDVNQPNPSDTSFGYLQSLLDIKKRETDELLMKIEYLSTQLWVQEETKTNIAKQLRYWRYKASSLEAQMSAVQTKPKSDFVEDVQFKLLSKKFDDFTGLHNDDPTTAEIESPLLISSPKSNITLPPNLGNCKVVDQSVDKENMVIEQREFKCTKNSDNEEKPNEFPKKILRFAKNIDIEKSNNSQRPTDECKYPVVYISTESSAKKTFHYSLLNEPH